jgi:glycosyltransferase involved in cell wall biosynthesis
MRIILSVDYISRLNTGIANMVKIMTSSYINLNHEVYIAAIDDRFTDLDKKNYPTERLLIIKNKNYVQIFYKYLNFYKKSNADIAHINSLWSISTIAIYVWSKLYNKSYIISTNGMINEWSLKQSSVKKNILLFFIFKKIIKNANSIIVNSTSEKIFLISKFKISKIHIIPNGIQFPKPMKIDVKNTDKNIILFLSRIHPKKGIDLLLKAWEEIFYMTKSHNYELHIVGFTNSIDNLYENKILNEIKQNTKLSNVFIFDGIFGNDMWLKYQECAAFILPTYSEGSAIVVLNAWASEKIAITTIESNLEYGLEENCTILINNSIKSIKDGILKFMNYDSIQKKKSGITGFNIVNKYYNWEIIFTKYLKIYDNSIKYNLNVQ